jgi:hypothetical protein
MARRGKIAAAVTGDPGVSLPTPVALMMNERSGMPASTASFSSADPVTR